MVNMFIKRIRQHTFGMLDFLIERTIIVGDHVFTLVGDVGFNIKMYVIYFNLSYVSPTSIISI